MKILIFDIETAPKRATVWDVWNSNVPPSRLLQDGYMMSWAAKWHKKNKVYTDQLINYDNKLEDQYDMAKGLYELMDEADAIVGYNSRRFDIPIVNTIFATAGLTPPSPYKSIDLYRTIKSKFKFTYNKLDFVCRQLGIGGKVEHSGQELWNLCMQGNKKAWRTMKKYNIQDVHITEQLYDKVLPWIDSHPSVPLYQSGTVQQIQCKHCGSPSIHQPRGTHKTAVGIYKRYQCKDCGTHFRGATLLNTPQERALLGR